MEFRTDTLPEGRRGQVVVFPATAAQDAHRQAFRPQEDAGVFALLWKETRGQEITELKDEAGFVVYFYYC